MIEMLIQDYQQGKLESQKKKRIVYRSKRISVLVVIELMMIYVSFFFSLFEFLMVLVKEEK